MWKNIELANLPVSWKNIDFRKVIVAVSERLGWDSFPSSLLEIADEVNASDIRNSGDLFFQTVTLQREVLDQILMNANKCSAFGFTTAQVMSELAGNTKRN
ncbi:MAG: hypothetical protein H0Z39_10605 [Peptococcaceae bacterium]|nr:hypothetical protein [Peptococcaceae bacterium]